MSEVVIRVENLYKEYQLGTISHDTLYRDLQSWWANLRGKEDPNSLVSSSYSENANNNNKHFYALEDISFDVKQGEIVGIIGRNGAGKSTLLKVLSKVTAPTKGSVKIKGRVASLLEVGTGFHPELTGRENIYLNGTILGMKRKEIDEKFKEIVDFAEIKEFVDTPVKRYSSGMYVRLAFAVAAHLEPEILLVDEVLAVGDAEFQKKCLGKMGEIAEGGRTVLFVSHNMNAVQKLCIRSILLNNGKIQNIGETNDILDEYLSITNEFITKTPLLRRRDRKGNGNLCFTNVRFENFNGDKLEILSSGEDIRIVLEYMCKNDIQKNVLVSIEIITNGERFIHFDTYFTEQNFEEIPLRGDIICCIPKIPLMPGNYSLNLYSTSNMIQTDWIEQAVFFHVKSGKYFISGSLPPEHAAKILVDHNWKIKERGVHQNEEYFTERNKK